MILASIKPYYYYLIAEGIKKIEVRKLALKNLPQDIAFYMSKDEKSFAKIPKEFQEKYRKHFGKVGMRVVCDKVTKFIYDGYGSYSLPLFLRKATCLDSMKLYDYLRGKDGYGWHISDLKIYGNPKELSEFGKKCDNANEIRCRDCIIRKDWDNCCSIMCKPITRPPQSYMFVEER